VISFPTLPVSYHHDTYPPYFAWRPKTSKVLRDEASLPLGVAPFFETTTSPDHEVGKEFEDKRKEKKEEEKTATP
jgi:hypothetical protein